jgi:hypothetical protein
MFLEEAGRSSKQEEVVGLAAFATRTVRTGLAFGEPRSASAAERAGLQKVLAENQVRPVSRTGSFHERQSQVKRFAGIWLSAAALLISSNSDGIAQQPGAHRSEAAPIPLSVALSFDTDALVQLCYDQVPAIAYLEYDVKREVSLIKKIELNGDQHVIAEFPGNREPTSLSCSRDGQTIAAVASDERGNSLFLMRGKDTALYSMPHYWPFSKMGLYSLLSPDGKSIRLPEIPIFVAGVDLLREMKIFLDGEGHVFFMDDYLYFVRSFHSGNSEKQTASKYVDVGGQWIKRQERKISPDAVVEIARCGDHDVASLVGDSVSSIVLDEAFDAKRDWLARVGARRLFRKHDEPERITGGNGACAFPLLRPVRVTHLRVATGLARLDANGLQTFSFPYPDDVRLRDEIYFTKDGCYVLVQGPHTQLLRVETPQCQ